MYAVVYELSGKRRVERFNTKPEAMHCAIVLLERHRPEHLHVDIEDANGQLAFAHKDIVRTFAQVRH